MKAHVEIKKTLHTDNDKRFIVGSDIAFTLKNSGVRYIATIKEINNCSMKLHKIEVSNNSNVKEGIEIPYEMVVPYEDIKEGSCSYVSVD